jgi:hypothetical protein
MKSAKDNPNTNPTTAEEPQRKAANNTRNAGSSRAYWFLCDFW